MEHTTDFSTTQSRPAKPAGEPVVESASSITEGTESALDRTVSIHIVDPADMDYCSFWVGVFPKGKLEPQDLLANSDDLFGALELASKNGLNEGDPVMVSDTVSQPARFLYLLPCPNSDFRNRVDWIGRVTDTVKSWAPERIGVYLTPELLQRDEAQDLLNQLLRDLIQQTHAKDYFLIPGGHGFNAILNASLELKAEMLDESQGVSVFIYH